MAGETPAFNGNDALLLAQRMGGGLGSMGAGGGFAAGARPFLLLPTLDTQMPSLQALSPIAALNNAFSVVGGKKPGRPGLLGDFWQRIAIQKGPMDFLTPEGGFQPLAPAETVQQASLGKLSAPATPAVGGGTPSNGQDIG